jgi:hypothetical protein
MTADQFMRQYSEWIWTVFVCAGLAIWFGRELWDQWRHG